MRPEELYLTDIIEAADAIQRFLKDVEQNTFFWKISCPKRGKR
jgi:uncharacterized protein with HEPN domain